MTAHQTTGMADWPNVDSIDTRLEDGRAIIIRRLDGLDEPGFREGIARLSPQSRYQRFFSAAEVPPDRVIELLLDADGHDNIAWAALDASMPNEPGIGAVHAIRDTPDAAAAEYAIAVIDPYQGLGIARLLTATILLDARHEAVRELRIHTLSENHRMIAFVRSLGARSLGMDGTTTEYALDIREAIARLRTAPEPKGLRDVFRAFDEAAAATPSETPPAS